MPYLWKIAQQKAPSVLTDGKIYLEIGYKQDNKVRESSFKAFPNKQVQFWKTNLDRINGGGGQWIYLRKN